MNQYPAAGEIVEKNSYVNIEFSLGNPPADMVLMPDFVNKNVNEVLSWAVKNNIEVNINQKNLPEVNNGTVIEQSPVPDTVINSNVKVEITIAKSSKYSKEEIENYNFEYELPFTGNINKDVKIVQISSEGEYVLYNKPTLPGQKIKLYVPPRKDSKIRIFIDGVLIDEK